MSRRDAVSRGDAVGRSDGAGRTGFVKRRLRFLEGLPLFPLGILFALNAVDEFDRSAFAVLAPEIRDDFGLSNTAFSVIVGLYTVLILIGGLPIGLVGDRKRRTRLVIGAAILWGGMTIVTGIAPVIAVLVIARIGSGLGRVMNEAIHTSLLTDYYPRPVHGRVFAVHRAGNPVGLTIGPFLAGALAAVLGTWRWAFFLIAIPTFALAALALRLREPARGESEDAALAVEAAKEPPIPLARGWRWLFSVPSLKRVYVSAFFGGGVVFALQPILALFFDDVYGVEVFGRGLIGALNGIALLVGTLAGGAIADRLRARSLGRVAAVAGAAVGGVGVGILIVGLSPVLWVGVVGSAAAYLSIGLWTAPNISVLAIVLPARIRSLGIGVGVMFFGVGGFVFTVIAGVIADGPGIRAAVSTLAPIVALAGGIYLAAARFVSTDAERALRTLALEVQLRAERLRAGQQALLLCRGLDASYGKVQVLFGVDIDVQPGEIVALLGTNGAGKSTLLRAISGALPPSGGAVFFEGRNITYAEPHETAAMGIAHVPGGRGVFPSLTVGENLRVAAWLSRDGTRLDEVYRMFPVLRERRDTRASDLSGGEQQMLSLAQAFIARPTLLMIDELSLGLAPALVEQLLEAVRALHAQGTTVLLVEQSASLALRVAHRAFFLEKGRVRFAGPAADLAGRTDLLRAVFLATDGHGRRRAPEPSPDGAATVLEADGLVRSFGGIRAVDGVSFRVTDGAILGMIGPNGAGKTTVFDVLSGFLPPDDGRVLYKGADVTALPPEARARMGLGRSFQDARLFPSLTAAEAIAVALDRHVDVKDPVAAALGLPVVRRSEAAVRARVDELIDLVGLGSFRDKFVSELSTGTRRILDIACALAHRPDVLILDEPSSGIAQAETGPLADLLVRVRRDLGCSMLVIEHDIPFVTGVADELVALDLGRVIARGTPSEVVRHPAVVEAYLGGGAEEPGDGARRTKRTSGQPRARKGGAGKTSKGKGENRGRGSPAHRG